MWQVIPKILSPSFQPIRNPNKRRVAVKEIEKIIKTMMDNKRENRITLVISKFTKDFIKTTNTNMKKGGLHGLAAVTLGISQDVSLFLIHSLNG